MKCVTSGSAYTDIDALACAVGYAELFGCDAVLPGKFNSTIPQCVRDLKFNYLTDFTKPYNKFVNRPIAKRKICVLQSLMYRRGKLSKTRQTLT